MDKKQMDKEQLPTHPDDVRMPSTTEDHEAMDQAYDRILTIEERQILQEMKQERLLKKFVYEGDGGRIQDLTWEGVKYFANRRGGYEVEMVEVSDTDDGRMRAVFKVTDKVTGDVRYGGAEELKESKSPQNKFAFAKLISKAQRNALFNIIPASMREELIAIYNLRKEEKVIQEMQVRLFAFINEDVHKGYILQWIEDNFGRGFYELDVDALRKVSQAVRDPKKRDELIKLTIHNEVKDYLQQKVHEEFTEEDIIRWVVDKTNQPELMKYSLEQIVTNSPVKLVEWILQQLIKEFG